MASNYDSNRLATILQTKQMLVKYIEEALSGKAPKFTKKDFSLIMNLFYPLRCSIPEVQAARTLLMRNAAAADAAQPLIDQDMLSIYESSDMRKLMETQRDYMILIFEKNETGLIFGLRDLIEKEKKLVLTGKLSETEIIRPTMIKGRLERTKEGMDKEEFAAVLAAVVYDESPKGQKKSKVKGLNGKKVELAGKIYKIAVKKFGDAKEGELIIDPREEKKEIQKGYGQYYILKTVESSAGFAPFARCMNANKRFVSLGDLDNNYTKNTVSNIKSKILIALGEL